MTDYLKSGKFLNEVLFCWQKITKQFYLVAVVMAVVVMGVVPVVILISCKSSKIPLQLLLFSLLYTYGMAALYVFTFFPSG